VPILIDGHNLIGRMPTLSLQDPDDEAKLISLLKSYRARTGKSITVVFDPGGAFALPQTRKQDGIRVVFAPHGSNADAVISRRVGRERNPGGWLVVTSDRRLAEIVKQQGARIQSSEEFTAQLGPSQDSAPDWKDASLSPDEVEAWLAVFEEQD